MALDSSCKMWAALSPHYSARLHQQGALCVNSCSWRLAINRPRLKGGIWDKLPTLTSFSHLLPFSFSTLLILGSRKPLIIHLTFPNFLLFIPQPHTQIAFTLQDQHKFTVLQGKEKILPFKCCLSLCVSHGFIQSWGGFACQWQGPVWVFIYLFYESWQRNHISHGCTVSTGLHRVLSLLCSHPSLSVSVFKTSQVPSF